MGSIQLDYHLKLLQSHNLDIAVEEKLKDRVESDISMTSEHQQEMDYNKHK